MACSVCVVGSIVMDLVVHAPSFVRPGETVMGDELELHPGGKGANQAVAASRMGAHVTLVGCLGRDDWGTNLRGVFASEGLDLQYVRQTDRALTGAGLVTIVPGGENGIVLAPGANTELGAEDVDAAANAIASADVLVVQCEVPFETSLRAAEIARRASTQVLLNAAPAHGVPPELLAAADVLVVNRAEAARLVGDEEREIPPAGLTRRLASFGPDRVVVTLADEGAVLFDGENVRHFEAIPVDAVDSTGAGDAFVGSLAVLLSEGARLKDSVRFACAAGALACSVRGAIPSLPGRDAVEALLTQSPLVD